MSQKNKFVKQHTIGVAHMRAKLEYFGEALAICEQFGLFPLMKFNCDFDDTLVA